MKPATAFAAAIATFTAMPRKVTLLTSRTRSSAAGTPEAAPGICALVFMASIIP